MFPPPQRTRGTAADNDRLPTVHLTPGCGCGEIADIDRIWVAAHHPGRALLHRVGRRHGLTDPDFVVLDEWLCASR